MLLLPLLDSELEMGVLIALMMPGNERNDEHMIVICIIYHEGKYSGLFMNFLQKFWIKGLLKILSFASSF